VGPRGEEVGELRAAAGTEERREGLPEARAERARVFRSELRRVAPEERGQCVVWSIEQGSGARGMHRAQTAARPVVARLRHERRSHVELRVVRVRIHTSIGEVPRRRGRILDARLETLGHRARVDLGREDASRRRREGGRGLRGEVGRVVPGSNQRRRVDAQLERGRGERLGRQGARGVGPEGGEIGRARGDDEVARPGDGQRKGWRRALDGHEANHPLDVFAPVARRLSLDERAAHAGDVLQLHGQRERHALRRVSEGQVKGVVACHERRHFGIRPGPAEDRARRGIVHPREGRSAPLAQPAPEGVRIAERSFGDQRGRRGDRRLARGVRPWRRVVLAGDGERGREQEEGEPADHVSFIPGSRS
jgi:hypothetical protein